MDCLAILMKFNDIKDVADCINDIIVLRYYYRKQRFTETEEYISGLTKKYFVAVGI